MSEKVSGALRKVGEELGIIETAEAEGAAERVKRYNDGLTLLAEQKKLELDLRAAQGANAAELARLKRDELIASQATADAAVRETQAKIKAEGTVTAELKQKLEERKADARALENDAKVLQAEARNRQTAALTEYLNNRLARFTKGGALLKSENEQEIAALRARGADELTLFRA
jgi:hypothetical protein